MAEQFAPGDDCFTVEGQAAIYVGRSLGDHVIRRVYDGNEDREPSFGRPEIVSEVFSTSPEPRFAARVGELTAEIAVKTEELRLLRQERARFDSEERERRQRIAAHGYLKTLDDLLAGRITHVVYRRQNYDMVVVKTLARALEEREYSSDPKAVYVEAKGFQPGGWQIAGLKGWDPRLCSSEEEAKAAAAEMIAEAFARQQAQSSGISIKQLLACCETVGIDPPAGLAEAVQAEEAAKAAREVAEAEKRLADARAKAGAAA